jgi:hypothetical protein
MPACHTKPFIGPGVLISADSATMNAPHDATPQAAPAETCDYCGSIALEWRKCKLICADCRQINKSCADL